MGSTIVNLSKSAIYLNYFRMLDIINKKSQDLDGRMEQHLQEIREKGYTVVEGFYSKEQCSKMRIEIDNLIRNYSNTIWVDERDADHRIYGAEKVSKRIASYNEDPFIRQMTAAFHQSKCNYFMTMAARMEAKNQNQGSGGGWHRDSVHLKQIKSIIYLTDVYEENGPFQYIEGSHKYASVYHTIKDCGMDFGQNRLSSDEVDKILATGKYKKIDFHAPAGSLVLADTFGIHRGKPIELGVRYAITNYFYASHLFDRKLKHKLEKLRVA